MLKKQLSWIKKIINNNLGIANTHMHIKGSFQCLHIINDHNNHNQEVQRNTVEIKI